MHSRQRMAVHELMLFVAERCAEKNRRERGENKKKKEIETIAQCTYSWSLSIRLSLIFSLQLFIVPFHFSFLFFQRSMSSLFFLLKQNNVMRVHTHVSLASRGEKELKAILFNR